MKKNQILHTSKRTYFFNHYDNGENGKILQIIESKKNAQGKHDRNSINIFEEDLADFLAMLEKNIE